MGFRQKISPGIRAQLLRLAAPVVWLRRRLRPHRVALSRAAGTAGAGGETLALLCGATEVNKNYLLGLAYDSVPQTTPLGNVRLRDAFRPEFAAKQNCPLTILETNPSLHEWLDDGGWFFIPAWVAGEIQLPLADHILSRDTLRTIFRRIRKHGYEYEVTSDPERFRDYYREMHLPYVTKVYGGAAFPDPYGERLGDNGGFDLVLLRKKDRPDLFLAGFLIVYEPDAPKCWSVGVRDGDPELVKAGALAALYVFCFEHLVKKGFRRVSMGAARPFLRDGVLNFKRRLSQTIVGERWEGFSLRISALTPGTKRFLLENPFIFRTKDRLHGAVFTDAELSPETITALNHDFFYPGLASLVIFTFRAEETGRPVELPPELAGHLVIRPAADLVNGRLHLP